jgi:hypothetical protein
MFCKFAQFSSTLPILTCIIKKKIMVCFVVVISIKIWACLLYGFKKFFLDRISLCSPGCLQLMILLPQLLRAGFIGVGHHTLYHGFL